ncbi:MAG: hypothetical protein A2511_05300 [Deltaproteobacteria bacterium RIFOXYD12_FULL_50_9]|nr:MAG: hypothetical protein A2511_05300 [Deltaproteobacteria bacterium RIFOXYD12_FULL_50_9]
MNTNMTATKTTTLVTTQVGIDTVTKASITIMGATSALIGLWAVGCMISAMISVGPISLVKAWFTALV